MQLSHGLSSKIQTTLMAIIVALLLWFGRQFLDLKIQASRIESDTIYMRANQSEIKEDIKLIDARVRSLEINAHAKGS